MIIFENSGEIDPRLITTIGVNVKPESTNPIGFFGTGLKYAIAGALRLGETLIIESGLARYQFFTRQETIRGKSFDIIYMKGSAGSPLELSFTTELGKTWEPWMIYRELWCNAQDEPAPRVYEAAGLSAPVAGRTRIAWAGAEAQSTHDRAHEFLLPSATPMEAFPELEIYPAPANGVFYRGILVLPLAKPTRWTYNIVNHVLTLTEDRMASHWEVNWIITHQLAKHAGESVLESIFEGGDFEQDLDFSYATGQASSTFTAVAKAANPTNLHSSVLHHINPPATTLPCPHCGGSGRVPKAAP